jgi:hypothetical protein
VSYQENSDYDRGNRDGCLASLVILLVLVPFIVGLLTLGRWFLTHVGPWLDCVLGGCL